MGEVTAEATLKGPRGGTAKLRLVVDTGSTYTWIPAEVAIRIGIRPVEIATFYLADGRRIRRRVGEASIGLLGRHGTRFVVFARKGDANVIGVDTLEGLLLQVDPVGHRLRKRRSAQAISPRAVGFVSGRKGHRAVRRR
jgi:clan AA aspartic protease